MKNIWPGLIADESNSQDSKPLDQWGEKESPLSDSREDELASESDEDFQIDSRPIEPQGQGWRPNLFKLFIFLIIVVYIVIFYFHAPILTGIGKYLIVRNPLEKSDLIICMAGEAAERGLETADIYKEGYAPQVFVSREQLSPAYSVLEERGVRYSESRDLLIDVLQGLGVPRTAMFVSDSFVESTIEEALAVRSAVLEKNYRSLIVVTSPTHTRRSLLTFKHVFEEDEIKIIVVPSKYSDFSADTWWKTRRHLKEVFLEYQKLIYYTLKYFW